MVKKIPSLLFATFIFLQGAAASGQGMSPVLWEFKGVRAEGNMEVISAIAHIAPGWHLYSQFIEAGGPVPTRFQFQPGTYTIVGTIREIGRATKVYDTTYEMDITWYCDSVTFQQRIMSDAAITTVRGNVVYMTCNNEICIPAEKEFVVEIAH